MFLAELYLLYQINDEVRSGTTSTTDKLIISILPHFYLRERKSFLMPKGKNHPKMKALETIIHKFKLKVVILRVL